MNQVKLSSDIWIVIPAYNEAERISAVLKDLIVTGCSIAVVNDCSQDNTADIVRQFPCHLINHPVNLGAGGALQTGMEYALSKNAQYIVHFDADGQMQVKDIPAVLEPVQNNDADVVIGSRYINKDVSVPFTKRLLIHKPAIWLNYILTGVMQTDAHCGFRALNRHAAQCCRFRINRMAHATELLDLIRRNNLRLKEVPVDILYHEYGQNFFGGLKIIKDLVLEKL